MLVFLSDLHFTDGTVGKGHNVSLKAFTGAFEDIKNYCKKASELKIILLGDIFDLNRTTDWLKKDLSERPWGDVEKKKVEIGDHALNILQNIINDKDNSQVFDFFRNSLPTLMPIDFQIIYIPGNHDRLCNLYPLLRKKVREALGIPVNDIPFSHVFDDPDTYRVRAMHGHEYDVMNYEGAPHVSESNYEQAPIGDLITTEIAARLPQAIMNHVNEISPPMQNDKKTKLEKNLQEIDNIRPYSALFEWVFYQVRENSKIKKEINEAIKEVLRNFEQIPYLQRWYKRHDKWNFTSDEADKLQNILRLAKLVDIDSAESILKLYFKLFGSPDDLPLEKGDLELRDAAVKFFTSTSQYQYMVMGHTHNPMQCPVRITSAGKEQVYLNTGTWRAKYIKGIQNGFVNLKTLSYVIIYSQEENPTQRFETWTGTLKEE